MTLSPERIDQLLRGLTGSGSSAERAAVRELLTMGARLPELFREEFRRANSWRKRCAFLYYALGYIRTHPDDAVLLGREALRDRSRVVRYRACMLLAYAQRKDALPDLQEARKRLKGKPGEGDVLAAIDAIEHENHNYFVDRNHSGKVKMTLRAK